MGVANYRGEETYYINTVTVSEMPEKKEADAGDESSFQLQDMVDYEMVDFEASHDRDVKEMLKISDSMSDKLAFTIFSANVALTGFLMGAVPEYFYIFHTIKSLILLPYRWYTYRKIKNHYFLFDFCYYVNFLLLIYIWSPWQLGFMFPILFALCNGPLLLAIALWRNSLVPHSVDKMTSLMLHISPVLTTRGLRWYSKEEQGFLLCSNPTDDPINGVCGHIGWVELIVWPIICSLVWGILYYSVILVWRAERIRQREYVNSYTYLLKRKTFGNIFDMMGPQYRRSMYLVWHTVYILLASIIAYYSYFSHVYHFVFVFIMMIVACYNGASFYVDVFGKAYYRQKEDEKEQKQTKLN